MLRMIVGLIHRRTNQKLTNDQFGICYQSHLEPQWTVCNNTLHDFIPVESAFLTASPDPASFYKTLCQDL
jgi:hypothetical protein